MRLTGVVRMPQLYKRMKDMSWKKWRKPVVHDLETERKLREAGIEVVDANEYVREMDQHLYPVDWMALPDMKPTFPEPPTSDRSHPNWHNTPIMVFDSQSFPMEGVNQAQAFSKSVQIKKGLPDDLMEYCKFTKISNPGDAAERIVKQAFLWDAYTEKLPNLKNFDYPTRVFRRPMGIPARRSNDLLMRNLLRLIEQDNPETSWSKMISNDEDIRVNLNRHGSNVQLKLSPLMNIMSKQPVRPFATSSEVQEADGIHIPNIYPFLSTANINNQNIYEEGDFLAVSPNSAFPHLHTAIFSHHIPGSHTHIHPRWNDDRYSGTTIMYAFATALLAARRRFGNDVSTLPEPVTSQVVHLTGKEFQFAVFQLNTVDFDDNSTSKVKNIVWLMDKISLFSHIENKLGTELFEGYNPEPFTILKGLYSRPTIL